MELNYFLKPEPEYPVVVSISKDPVNGILICDFPNGEETVSYSIKDFFESVVKQQIVVPNLDLDYKFLDELVCEKAKSVQAKIHHNLYGEDEFDLSYKSDCEELEKLKVQHFILKSKEKEVHE